MQHMIRSILYIMSQTLRDTDTPSDICRPISGLCNANLFYYASTLEFGLTNGGTLLELRLGGPPRRHR